VTDAIELRGLRVTAFVGALPEERERAQPLEIDLDVVCSLAAAGASDRLDDTVDYGAICEAVARVVREEHHQLLERLATRIAAVCRSDRRVQHVVVEVRKLRPPVPVSLDHVAVRIER
jgi:dihydroneopterin aldolase